MHFSEEIDAVKAEKSGKLSQATATATTQGTAQEMSAETLAIQSALAESLAQAQLAVDSRLREYIAQHQRISIEPGLCGAENMRRDEANAKRLLEEENLSEVFIRLYSWKPWCLSLGANQKESDINLEALSHSGIDMVRRSTGGRAVLHADELTYSLVMRLGQGVQVHDVYRVSHELLREGLERLGAKDIVFQKSSPNFAQRYRTSGDSVSCFTSAARSEIMWNERKVVGSAQRVWGSVLLQHGSILLGRGHEQLADLVRLSSDEARAKLRSSIRQQSVSMEQICNRVISFDECAQALQSSLMAQ